MNICFNALIINICVCAFICNRKHGYGAYMCILENKYSWTKYKLMIVVSILCNY